MRGSKTEFLFNFIDIFKNFSYKQNIIKCLEHIHSFYEIIPDCEDLGVFYSGEGVLIFERLKFFCEGGGVSGVVNFF